ncbi:hypothetical protein [Pantoea agglomerans]|uniref:hypothetical protein n=1 Tax=Enterobacter agglomerans TaxID=549 RepID=UPI000255431A|nr:hypothetical protein [Pantoea agglomerans]
MIKIGIYGFTFSKEMTFSGGKLIPLYSSLSSSKKNKVDGNHYVLSGFFIPESNDYNHLSQLTFDLSAVLSFIEQKNVIIAGELEKHDSIENLPKDYAKTLKSSRHAGSGKLIMEDAFSPDSRSKLLNLAMDKLTESANVESDAFRTAFFKSMLKFREPIHYVDVSYYLLFSSLEALARDALQNFKPGKTPQVITDFLQNLNFEVEKNEHVIPQRNILHYTKLRNSLFHEGVYKADLDNDKEIYLEDYFSNINMLLPLVFMKVLNFDDGFINWDSWIDRQPFKSPAKS